MTSDEGFTEGEMAWKWMVDAGWVEVHPDGKRVRFTKLGWAEYAAMQLPKVRLN